MSSYGTVSYMRTPFGAFATLAVSWEGAAVVTEKLQQGGLISWRVPFITEVVRPLPRPARVAFTMTVAAVIGEHIEQTRFHRRALGLFGTRALARQ